VWERWISVELSGTKTSYVHFLHVHVPIFLHTGIEYIHEKSASLEKCKKVDMARFSTRELNWRCSNCVPLRLVIPVTDDHHVQRLAGDDTKIIVFSTQTLLYRRAQYQQDDVGSSLGY